MTPPRPRASASSTFSPPPGAWALRVRTDGERSHTRRPRLLHHKPFLCVTSGLAGFSNVPRSSRPAAVSRRASGLRCRRDGAGAAPRPRESEGGVGRGALVSGRARGGGGGERGPRGWGRGCGGGFPPAPGPPVNHPPFPSSDPASPPLQAPALRRSQRKSGSEPNAPPQPSTPAPWKAFSLRKIGPRPPAEKRAPETPAKRSEPRTPEAPSSGVQKSIPAKRSAPQTPAERSAPQIPAKRSAPRTPAERSAPQTPVERSAPQIPAKRSAPRTPAERSAPQIPAKRSAPQTPVGRNAPQIPAKRSAPQTPAERNAPQTPAERSAPQTPVERSAPQIPAKRSAPRTPAERSAPQIPAKRSASQTPAEKSAPQTPVERIAPRTPRQRSTPQTQAEKSIPGTSIEKGAPSSRPKRSGPQILAERSVPQTPKAASPVARRAISVKKLAARTQESQSPASRGGRSATKRKGSLSAEVTLSEKENSPPLQENVSLHKDSSSLTAGPAPEVTPTVLGPLTPNVTRPQLMDARDLEMSRKVRRSYSRLDELGLGSTSTPNYQRRSFFGFERLLSGEELENVSPVVKEPKQPTVASSTEAWGPDSILPGIPMTKEKRRKRKVPEILKSELDEWAAAMNAQFEAAEKFDLLVE
uniref:Cell division cycle associated 5 n=1 Tax=Sarcophilus harrisii TaxID=9305 RepID=A0A7N4PVH9_SARHA